jgi:hypothetical protein
MLSVSVLTLKFLRCEAAAITYVGLNRWVLVFARSYGNPMVLFGNFAGDVNTFWPA